MVHRNRLEIAKFEYYKKTKNSNEIRFNRQQPFYKKPKKFR